MMIGRLVQCRMIRCLVFGVFVALTTGLHVDEAGVIDWHHKLIGTPLESSTFLHKPVSGSGALAFTLTDRDVLAALNLRDGSIGRAMERKG